MPPELYNETCRPSWAIPEASQGALEPTAKFLASVILPVLSSTNDLFALPLTSMDLIFWIVDFSSPVNCDHFEFMIPIPASTTAFAAALSFADRFLS